MFPMNVSFLIESAQELAALHQAIALLTSQNYVPPTVVDIPKKAPVPGSGKKESAEQVAEKESTKPTPTETKKPEPTPPVELNEVSRAAVSALAVKLAVKDRTKALDILQEFGIKAVKEAAEDQLPQLHAKFAAALEG